LSLFSSRERKCVLCELICLQISMMIYTLMILLNYILCVHCFVAFPLPFREFSLETLNFKFVSWDIEYSYYSTHEADVPMQYQYIYTFGRKKKATGVACSSL